MALKNSNDLADGIRRIARAADAFGNLPQKAGLALDNMVRLDGSLAREYRYNSLGHLTGITHEGELLQGNEYDGLGRRVHTFGQLSGAFGGDIRYTIDDTGEFPHILMEQGGRERKYLWQENTLCGMPEEGRYVLTDPLGTPLVVAGPDGQVQNAYRYDEFGLSEYRREEAPLPFGFTGYLADRVEGLYYANAREYHAGSGRFLIKDLSHYMDFKDPGTLNLYQYAKGTPLKYVDPSGHESINKETVIPVIGVFKYADDLVYGVKALFKNGDDVLDTRNPAKFFHYFSFSPKLFALSDRYQYYKYNQGG